MKNTKATLLYAIVTEKQLWR